MYEFFEHTADLGLRARAADRDTLFVEMATALFAAVVEDLSAVRPMQKVELQVAGTDLDFLLFDWLRELLMRFDADHVIYSKFDATIVENGLIGVAWGEPLDPARHLLSHEVKAITYHDLRVEPDADGWVAEVIVDI